MQGDSSVHNYHKTVLHMEKHKLNRYRHPHYHVPWKDDQLNEYGNYIQIKSDTNSVKGIAKRF